MIQCNAGVGVGFPAAEHFLTADFLLTLIHRKLAVILRAFDMRQSACNRFINDILRCCRIIGFILQNNVFDDVLLLVTLYADTVECLILLILFLFQHILQLIAEILTQVILV